MMIMNSRILLALLILMPIMICCKIFDDWLFFSCRNLFFSIWSLSVYIYLLSLSIIKLARASIETQTIHLRLSVSFVASTTLKIHQIEMISSISGVDSWKRLHQTGINSTIIMLKIMKMSTQLEIFSIALMVITFIEITLITKSKFTFQDINNHECF
jgi:hypothetical protein